MREPVIIMKLIVPHTVFLDSEPTVARVEFYLYRRYNERRMFAKHHITKREEAALEMQEALLKSLKEDRDALVSWGVLSKERKNALAEERRQVEQLGVKMDLEMWNRAMGWAKWPLLKSLAEVPKEQEEKKKRVVKSTPAMRKILRV